MNFTLSYSEYSNYPKSGNYVKMSLDDFYTDEATGKIIETPNGYYIDEKGNYVKLEMITHHYDIEVTKGYITVNGKTMPIKENREYSYKLQKTQIQAKDLPFFFSDYGENKDGDDLTKSFWNGAFAQICAHVVKYGKQHILAA